MVTRLSSFTQGHRQQTPRDCRLRSACLIVGASAVILWVVSSCLPARASAPMRPGEIVENPIAVGTRAANISYFGVDGKRQLLAGNKGKLVFLIFFAHYCDVCIEEVQKLQRIAQPGVALVPIEATGADLELTQLFQHRYKISSPVFFDRAMAGAKAFGAQRTPRIFVISPDFVVRDDHRGETPPGYFARWVARYRPASVPKPGNAHRPGH
jgi:thiol-disulfide isomerase/thioredoxin